MGRKGRKQDRRVSKQGGREMDRQREGSDLGSAVCQILTLSLSLTLLGYAPAEELEQIRRDPLGFPCIKETSTTASRMQHIFHWCGCIDGRDIVRTGPLVMSD